MSWWIAGWIAAAGAAEVGLVGAHDAGLAPGEQVELMARIAAVIDAAGDHDALTPAEVSARYAGREDLVLQEALTLEGRKLLEDGRLLYQQAEVEDAAWVLEGAVRTLEAASAVTRSVKELWEAQMLLATARLAAGEEEASRDAIGAALALQPGRRPDPATYPPAVIAAFEVERELADGEVATLTVGGEPGARVWVDGREVGVAPATAPDLLPGLHHVHVRAGERVGYLRVEVSGGTPVTVTPRLGPPSLGEPPRAVGARSQQVAALYDAIGRNARIDALLLVGRVDEVVQLQVYHPATSSFSAPVVLDRLGETDAILAAAERLVAGLGPDGGLPLSNAAFTALPFALSDNRLLARDLLTPVAPVAAPVGPQGGPERAPVQEAPVARGPRWPVWLGVGLGAAALGAGAAALGVVLGGDGAPTSGGTIVVGQPLR